jgi:biofilm PGA synthesis N-glycosyltransferase PgaC
MLNLLFWSALGLLAYLYAGYPLLMALWARLAPRPVRKGAFEGRVSVLLSVHNEAAALGAKLRSVVQAGPVAEVLVGSDGSTDDVGAAVASVGDPRIRLMAFPARRGKPAVLNDLMREVTGDVVVLTDARQPLDPAALPALLANFADPSVGVVSGELILRAVAGDSTAARGVDAYWRYEKFIRRSESRARSVPGATGALYAIRRSLLRPVPPDVLLDDVAIPMQAVCAGARCVFEEGARVYDAPSQSSAQEQVRKRRTIAGNWQLVKLYPRLLLPWRNPIWFEFVSHKMLRLLSPLLMVLLAVLAIFAPDGSVVAATRAPQGLFYLLALAGWGAQRAGWRTGWLGVPYMFVVLNLVTALALWDAARGRFQVAWVRAGGVHQNAGAGREEHGS